jgi:hypothetical protein
LHTRCGNLCSVKRTVWLGATALVLVASACGSTSPGVDQGASLRSTDPTVVSTPDTGSTPASDSVPSTDSPNSTPTTDTTTDTPPDNTQPTATTDSTNSSTTSTTSSTGGPTPTLGPDEQPETAEQARALLALGTTSPLPPEFAHYPDFFAISLRQVANGTLVPDDFFDSIAVQITAGVIANPYLVCPIGLGEACTASRNDIGPYLDDCDATQGMLLSTQVVETATSWAGVAVCVFVPLPATISTAEQSILAATTGELSSRSASTVVDDAVERVADAMAQSVATVPDLTAGQPEYADFSANVDQLSALSPSGRIGYVGIEFVTPSLVAGVGSIADQVREQIGGFDMSFVGTPTVHVGVGSFVARGRLTVYVAWYDPT